MRTAEKNPSRLQTQESCTGTCAVPDDSRDSVPSIHPSHCNQGPHHAAKCKSLARHGELVREGSGIVRSPACRRARSKLSNGQRPGYRCLRHCLSNATRA
jgi:hypothetical protein